MNELLPCPFCGGNARAAIWMDEIAREKRMNVTCQRCGAGSEVFHGEAHAELLAAWNRRPPLRDAGTAPLLLYPCELPQFAGLWIGENGQTYRLVAIRAELEPK